MSATVEAQRPANPAHRAWQWLVDANPVLAKELLVTARTRVYAGAILVAPLLLAALLLVIRTLTRDEDSDIFDGNGLLQVYLVGLAVLLGALGALLGATVVLQDREGGTIEALRFSRVRPGSIIVAKFTAILLAELAVIACSVPLAGYLVATTGVTSLDAAIVTLIALAFGAMTAALGLGISSLAPNIRVALVLSLLGAGLLGIGLCAWYGSIWELERCFMQRCTVVDVHMHSPFERRVLPLFVVLPVSAFVTVLWGGLAAGVSGLLDTSEDRTRPIKGWTLAALAMTAITAYALASSEGEHARATIAGLCIFFIAVASIAILFAFVGEPLTPSRRVRARPRSALPRLFAPALVPSIAFVLVTGGLGFLGIPLLVRSPEFTVIGLWVFLYVSALGGFLGFVAVTKGVRRARWMGVFAAPAFLAALLQNHSHGATALDCVCPFWIGNSSPEACAVWSCSLALWGLTACVMLGLMVNANRKAAGARA